MKTRSIFGILVIFTIFSIFQLGMISHAYGQICGTSPMLPGIVSECDFCMCSQGISPLAMGGSSLRLDTRYTDLSQQFTDGARVSRQTSKRPTSQIPFPLLKDYLADSLLLLSYHSRTRARVRPFRAQRHPPSQIQVSVIFLCSRDTICLLTMRWEILALFQLRAELNSITDRPR
jgi:hypothetical protein